MRQTPNVRPRRIRGWELVPWQTCRTVPQAWPGFSLGVHLFPQKVDDPF